MARRGAPPPGRVMAGQRPGGRGVLWDTRVWASLGGKGKVGSSRVFRLKLWWDHMGTGSVRSRALQAKLARTVVRVAAEHEDTAVADGERVEVLRKQLEASLKWSA